MHHDGPKKVGRFIKKGSKVLKRISLAEFSFQEICSAGVVSHDNQSRSIIHSKFHAPEHIEKNIKAPDRFDDDLQSDSMRRPVLIPLDFTRDWERDKKIRKSRIARQGDDEDVDFDLESEDELRAGLEAAEKQEESAEDEAPAAAPAAKNAPHAAANPAPAAKPKTNVPPAPSVQPPSEGPRYDSMDVVGKAIKNLMHSDDGPVAEQPLTASPLRTTPPAPVASAPQTPTPMRSNEFIPVGAAGNDVDPEEEAALLYQKRVAEEKLLEEKVAIAVEEAKAKGYRDGYILGEEKAELQAQQKTASMFGKVGELIQEFGNLKLEILSNVQENFYELSQAMGEALLKREFSIKPDAFALILRRAISESIEPGEFKIRVSPEMYDRISSLGDPTLTKTLVKDQDIPLGDFKIESNLSVVDGQVSKLIKDLLEQADLNIFDVNTEDEDASIKKAG